MQIAVGVSSGELARYAVFYESLMMVEGVTTKNVIHRRGPSIAENRNKLAEMAWRGGFDAIWYVDDDHIFKPDTLARLRAHDKDIVAGLYLKRDVPFVPLVFDREGEGGGCFPKLLGPGDHGLIPAKAVGSGCMLVKRRVFEAMDQPWWRLGQLKADVWCDDIDFCRRARAAGFEVWCDLDCVVGHIMTGVMWPVCEEGEWGAGLLVCQEAIARWQGTHLWQAPDHTNATVSRVEEDV